MTLTIKNNTLTWEDPPGSKYSVTGLPVVVVPPEEPPTTTPPPTQPPTLPPVGTSQGIWISRAEIERLPMAGAAWDAVLSAANSGTVTPKLSDQDSPGNVTVLAQALAYARTNDPTYKDKVLSAIQSIINTQSESGGRTLALGRELAAFVVAADLIGLEPAMKQVFGVRLRELIHKTLDGMTLIECHRKRPNNWGTHAGASIAAVAAYLGDRALLDSTATVFRGYLGDRASYDSFTYNDPLSWHADPSKPVGINPKGAVKDGFSIDGVLPDDMRRTGGFTKTPSKPNYPYGGLDGAYVCAEILTRQGYPAWEWQDRALLRAGEWLYKKWPADGDNAWQVALFNKVYGTSYPVTGTGPGKGMGWAQWTHA
jgi:hypothetical protein